jgi:hypothetical protein
MNDARLHVVILPGEGHQRCNDMVAMKVPRFRGINSTARMRHFLSKSGCECGFSSLRGRIVSMVKTPKQFLQLLRNTLVDNVRVHGAQLLADIQLNLGREPCVACFDIVLSGHHICQPSAP